MSNEHVEDVDQEMYIRDRELDETESATPSVNPLGNQPNIERENVRDRDDSHLLRIIADALQRVAGTVPATISTPTTRRAPIKELRKYGATEFLGLKGIDPSTAENWMESTKRVLQQLECTPRESLICAVSLLQGEAYLWWESKKYVGELYIEDKRQEFLMLKQGNLSVVDYEREFSRLSRYAFEFIPTELIVVKGFFGSSTERSREFRDSWKSSFRSDRGDKNRGKQTAVSTGSVKGPSRNIDIPDCEHCGKKHLGECWRKTRRCFRCGSTDHFIRDCQKNEGALPAASQRSVSTARGRGSGRGSSLLRGGNIRRSSDIAIQQSEVKVPARAYVVRTREEGDAHDVVTDCYKKRFGIQTEDGDRIEVNGIRTSRSTRIISAIKASKLLRQGCTTYLAYVINSDLVGSQCSQIRTVCEFLDVFPEELPGLPPDREVEFAIEVYPSTAPISIPPYRMSPTELKELKVQLQDLLDRGFIRPSISPWGAPVLFVKKKDGSMRLCIDYR
ncbi:uncharacterized protein [Gossypium hirsutum]|uniref:CCHC-type domain-containing protein n=1 Tax=Gossypium hirsutum TaxID=3635 RepID=A0ABM3A1L3_GOSHI|nr:uncharacterized protein LOC121217286 [Gossypium hirsutum]